MDQKKSTYTIHKSKKSLVDRGHTASEKLRKLLEETEYRIDPVGDKAGVQFVNDSRAIDLLSTRDTLKCLNKPLLWIAAAPAHDRDYALIKKHVKYKVKQIIVYGQSADFMKSKLGPLVDKFHVVPDLPSAVKLSAEVAIKGDTVVFSPACAPDDEYRNYVDRGRAFKQFVAEKIKS